ncbi:MAG: trypsin-like peptidase domain-containing protein [Nitrospira sp.]|nr:trypsin-like peptidase domain-containing protein [Nitrospira sp.]
MIKRTLPATQASTFSVLLPDPKKQGMPTATGTGFFVSPDGWFVTAAHVISENGQPNGPVRGDISQAWLMKETRIPGGSPGAMCQFVSFGHVLPDLDVALLKVDFTQNANKHWLQGKTSFPFLQISTRELEEGEDVYAFGYPLPETTVSQGQGVTIGHTGLCPRVTSAIVSSTFEQGRMVITGNDPKAYVLDKALNYGNSGGPIVSVDTGHVHALCSRFQPVYVPQRHLVGPDGAAPWVMVPSLYGVVSGLHHSSLIALAHKLGIPTVAQ